MRLPPPVIVIGNVPPLTHVYVALPPTVRRLPVRTILPPLGNVTEEFSASPKTASRPTLRLPIDFA